MFRLKKSYNLNNKKIIGYLCFFCLVLYSIQEFVYYNLYLFGNMDSVVRSQDWNYGINQSEFILGAPDWYKYIALLIYIFIALSIILYIGGKKFKASRIITYIFIVFFMLNNLAHSENPGMYLSGLTSMSETLAPGTVLAIFLAFLSYDNEIWETILGTLKYLIIFLVIFCFFGIVNFPFNFDANSYVMRLYAFKWLKGQVGCLTLLFPFVYVFNKKNMMMNNILLIFIMFTYILMQSRMQFIILVAVYIMLYFNVRNNELINVKVRKNITGWLIIFSIVIGIVLISSLFSFENILTDFGGRYVNIFFNRLTEDTRSSQYLNHLSSILESMPFGIGYPSTNVLINYDKIGIDNGLIMAAYYTGIPMVVCFIMFAFKPIIKALFIKNKNIEDVCIVVIGMSRILWLFSSSTISLSFAFIMLIFSVGRSNYINDNRLNVNVGSTIQENNGLKNVGNHKFF